MTVSDRIFVYERLIEDYNKRSFVRGLCLSLEDFKLEGFPTHKSINSYPELIVQRPPGSLLYWWPLNEEGRVKRIKALKYAIYLACKK